MEMVGVEGGELFIAGKYIYKEFKGSNVLSVSGTIHNFYLLFSLLCRSRSGLLFLVSSFHEWNNEAICNIHNCEVYVRDLKLHVESKLQKLFGFNHQQRRLIELLQSNWDVKRIYSSKVMWYLTLIANTNERILDRIFHIFRLLSFIHLCLNTRGKITFINARLFFLYVKLRTWAVLFLAVTSSP